MSARAARRLRLTVLESKLVLGDAVCHYVMSSLHKAMLDRPWMMAQAQRHYTRTVKP